MNKYFTGYKCVNICIVEIPKHIADWIEYCKSKQFTILGALSPIGKFGEGLANDFEGDVSACVVWAEENSEMFVSAWVNGYTIKKEKHYYIAVPVGKGVYNRVCIDNEGKVYLHSCGYSSIKNLIKLERKATIPITEEAIKNSPLSWAWQFAKELE